MGYECLHNTEGIAHRPDSTYCSDFFLHFCFAFLRTVCVGTHFDFNWSQNPWNKSKPDIQTRQDCVYCTILSGLQLHTLFASVSFLVQKPS